MLIPSEKHIKLNPLRTSNFVKWASDRIFFQPTVVCFPDFPFHQILPSMWFQGGDSEIFLWARDMTLEADLQTKNTWFTTCWQLQENWWMIWTKKVASGDLLWLQVMICKDIRRTCGIRSIYMYLPCSEPWCDCRSAVAHEHAHGTRQNSWIVNLRIWNYHNVTLKEASRKKQKHGMHKELSWIVYRTRPNPFKYLLQPKLLDLRVMTSENNDGFDKLWSSILLSSHMHVSLLSQSCRISLCTNPKDPNAQCVASKGMHEERLWAEGVTTHLYHLCKLVKLRKRNNYRWQTAKPLFEFSHKTKQCKSQHCDRCSPFVPSFVSPASSYLLHLWEFPGSVPRCSNCCPSHRNVGFALPSMAVPACTCQRLGLWLRHDTTFHHSFCFWAWLQHGQRCRPDSSRSPAAKSPRSSAWTWQCNEAFGNTWDSRLTSQECLASFQMEKHGKKHEKAEGYGYVKSWHSPGVWRWVSPQMRTKHFVHNSQVPLPFRLPHHTTPSQELPLRPFQGFTSTRWMAKKDRNNKK